jgi:hypothetical protein
MRVVGYVGKRRRGPNEDETEAGRLLVKQESSLCGEGLNVAAAVAVPANLRPNCLERILVAIFTSCLVFCLFHFFSRWFSFLRSLFLLLFWSFSMVTLVSKHTYLKKYKIEVRNEGVLKKVPKKCIFDLRPLDLVHTVCFSVTVVIYQFISTILYFSNPVVDYYHCSQAILCLFRVPGATFMSKWSVYTKILDSAARMWPAGRMLSPHALTSLGPMIKSVFSICVFFRLNSYE